MRINTIGVHHSGPIGSNPYSSSAHLTLTQIEAAHKARDFNLSNIGHYTGYTFVITREGLVVQTREIGKMTCAATGHNFDTIHICFIGNFTKKADGTPVDVMTQAQHLAYINLVMALLRGDYGHFQVALGADVKLSAQRIYPHRILQPGHTSCYGSFFDDNWARNQIINRMHADIAVLVKMVAALRQILLLLAPVRVGANDKSCIGGFPELQAPDEAVSASSHGLDPLSHSPPENRFL